MAQAIAKQIDQEVSTNPDVDKTPPVKRGPGRPAGSTNKKPPATKPTIDTTKSPAERIAAKAKADEAKAKDKPSAPDFTEWQDFLGEVVLHWFSVAFIAIAFRGIPYHEMLTQEDYEDIQLDSDEYGAIARPFAHLITHSKINGKYGRAIMNSRDSIEAAVVLFMWGSRVNRISKKYKAAYNAYVEAQENGISRIPRVDRPADTAEEIALSSEQPVIGIQRPAYGHGFN